MLARTGTPRRCACLIYGASGDEYAVVAFEGGAEEDPGWLWNHEADPSVGVGRYPAVHRPRPDGGWGQACGAVGSGGGGRPTLYDEYARGTTREIPIVLLSPLG